MQAACYAMEEPSRRSMVTILRNLLNNPSPDSDTEKFYRLRKGNPHLEAKIFPHAELLKLLGFEENSEAFVMPKDFNRNDVKKAMDVLLDIESTPITTSSSSSSSSSKRTIDQINGNELLEEEKDTKVQKTNVEELSSTTIFCDACGKARTLTVEEFQALPQNVDDQVWICSNLPRLKQNGGCEVPDDELCNIVGDSFALVFERIGIRSRKELAASKVSDYDGGPWEAYIHIWIQKAQQLEIEDIMMEVVEYDERYRAALNIIGLGVPADLVYHNVTSIRNLFESRANEIPPPTVEQVEQWLKCAQEKIKTIPWLNEWTNIPQDFIDLEEENELTTSNTSNTGTS